MQRVQASTFSYKLLGTIAAVVGSIVLSACGSDAPKNANANSAGSTTASSQCSSAGDAIKVVATPSSEISGLVHYTGMSRNHVDGCVAYPQTPPVGGNHSPVWQACTFYVSPIVKEHGVHSMEHGAVWITYRPDLAAAQRELLRQYSSNDYVLISRWDVGLPSPIVVSAWGLQLELPAASDPRLAQFVKTYANGPQTPEPGVPCRTGGTMAS